METSDHRRQSRARTLKSARILLNRHQSAISCTVRNLSPIGACLVVESLIGIPERFDVMFDVDHIIRACRMVWHQDKRIGVEFEPVADDLTRAA